MHQRPNLYNLLETAQTLPNIDGSELFLCHTRVVGGGGDRHTNEQTLMLRYSPMTRQPHLNMKPGHHPKVCVTRVTKGAIGCPAMDNFSRQVQAPLR